jgi:hypothetical protein
LRINIKDLKIPPGTWDLSLNSEWKAGASAAGYSRFTPFRSRHGCRYRRPSRSFHILVGTFTAFGDETVD